jgi:hypothetical protein
MRRLRQSVACGPRPYAPVANGIRYVSGSANGGDLQAPRDRGGEILQPAESAAVEARAPTFHDRQGELRVGELKVQG